MKRRRLASSQASPRKGRAAGLTPERQLELWIAGDARCPSSAGECCPDFGCCSPKMLWPEEKRRRFAAAGQGEREKMLMGALGALVGPGVHVTRGEPADHQ